jgi:hypothetical protein
MSVAHKDTVIKASKQTDTSCKITIPYLGTEYYKRIVHDNGRIELIPVEMMESAMGEKNGA